VREIDDLTTFMYRMSCKSGSLNLLEPSGPHRACYGTALPFTSHIHCPILMKFGVTDVHIMVLRICDFLKNWRRQSRIFHVGVHDSAFIRVP